MFCVWLSCLFCTKHVITGAVCLSRKRQDRTMSESPCLTLCSEGTVTITPCSLGSSALHLLPPHFSSSGTTDLWCWKGQLDHSQARCWRDSSETRLNAEGLGWHEVSMELELFSGEVAGAWVWAQQSGCTTQAHRLQRFLCPCFSLFSCGEGDNISCGSSPIISSLFHKYHIGHARKHSP